MKTARALLLTDVIDSTRVSHEVGDAQTADLWVLHDRAARDLLHTWNGLEVEKTDGLMAVFDRATDAFGYAQAYHRELERLNLPFKARAAIHYGAMYLRENRSDDLPLGAKRFEVDGLVKPTTARLAAIACGGQTLTTALALGAAGSLPFRVQSHGHWRLKGLPDAIELFEVGDDDSPFVPPADDAKAYRVVRQRDQWLPAREIRNSVPAERDSFVGREQPLRQLADFLHDGARLVSVVGVGGSGKTRLVTRFARTWLGDYPGGAWFCDLSQARSEDGVHFAVARGLEIPLGRGDPVAQIAHAIAARGPCLVILDNFEQVAKHAEATLGRWLDRAPEAVFLATTREMLGIVGEQVFVLEPLSSADAAALFLKRARSVQHAYAPTTDDLAGIERLVQGLDGLPLAIELAAARVQILSPGALLSRMHERFEWLSSRGGRSDRQSTLRATFDWSWDLLGENERAALGQLSVFEGGFTLASATAVVRLPSRSGPWQIADTVESLVGKSFVRRVGEDRFDLLETMRRYACERLAEQVRPSGSGSAESEEARARHWRHFSALGEARAVANRCVEADNLVAACRHAVAAAAGAEATGCLVGAWAVLRLTGPLRVAVGLAESVLAVPGLGDAQRAMAAWVAGRAMEITGAVAPARGHFVSGLDFATRSGDPGAMARLLMALGLRLAQDADLDEAQRKLAEADRLATKMGDSALRAEILNNLGWVMEQQSRFAEARLYYESALETARRLGDLRLEGGVLGNLGSVFHALGDLAEARRHCEQALALAHEVGDRRWAGNAHCNLGLLLQEQGHDELSRAQYEIALGAAREVGNATLEYVVLCNLGIVLGSEGELAKACLHFERAVTAATLQSDRRSEGQFRGYWALGQARLGQIAEAVANLDIAERLLAEMSDRLSLGLLMCQRAQVELLADQPARARAAIDAAAGIAKALGAGAESELGRMLAAAESACAGTSMP